MTVFEVGPRDGLQAEHKILGVDQRAELITKLVESGLQDIEVGSFVKADRIPQLQKTDEVVQLLNVRFPRATRKCRFWAFVPNEFGLRQAIENEIEGASFFIATSDTFCRKNVNRSQDELIESLAPLLKSARKSKVKSRIYLSTLVYCPYEGDIDPKKVETLVTKIAAMGASEIVLSDTTGHANPLSIRKVLERVLKKHPAKLFALHLHDTRGQALANIRESMDFGLSRFDSSVGGTGGCPYAPGASGNLATEDLVYMLKGMGLEKKIDLGALGRAGSFVESLLGKTLPSRVLRTLENNK